MQLHTHLPLTVKMKSQEFGVVHGRHQVKSCRNVRHGYQKIQFGAMSIRNTNRQITYIISQPYSKKQIILCLTKYHIPALQLILQTGIRIYVSDTSSEKQPKVSRRSVQILHNYRLCSIRTYVSDTLALLSSKKRYHLHRCECQSRLFNQASAPM